MKKLLILMLVLLNAQVTDASTFGDYLEKAKEVPHKVRDVIVAQDLSLDLGLGDFDIINGINIGAKVGYQVEPSYIDKYYSRVDKYVVKAGVNVGEIIKDAVDLPLSFSISRENSFVFARQFPSKKEAMTALPYSLKRLPINAKLALKNLDVGDFVSMPANLSIAFKAEASTSYVAPVILEAKAGAYVVVNGEFTVQVFKLDATHVRLKLITKKSMDLGGDIGLDLSTKFFGVNVIDHQIDRLFDRDLAVYGMKYNPGAQFIIDYVFDLSDDSTGELTEAQAAYNQILSSTLKFKDSIVANDALAKNLKDRLISSYELADELFAKDRNKETKSRRVQRIFKGFNDYKGHTNHLKFSMLVASHTRDTAFTESKVTFIDKNEKNMEFYYPTASKYIETKVGKFIFDHKDQSYQNNFGLIPRYNSEDSSQKNPDIGLTFEYKDRNFTTREQKTVDKFMSSEIPEVFAREIDLSEWNDGELKKETRIFFQLILKSQGFQYLKSISAEEIREKLEAFIKEKKDLHLLVTKNDQSAGVLERFLLLFDKSSDKESIDKMAASISKVLKNEKNNSEQMLKDLVALNEDGNFDTIGLGFLISLLPEEKLKDLVYLKLELIGKDLKPITAEIGTLNYRGLYKELNEVQSRLSSRGYDLRISAEDQAIQSMEVEKTDEPWVNAISNELF